MELPDTPPGDAAQAGMESCLAEIAARAAGSVMLSGGRPASSKNISSRPPGTIARTDAACLIDIHLKRTSYQEALRSGRLCLEGPRQLTEAFLTWVRPSPYADIVPALGHSTGGAPR